MECGGEEESYSKYRIRCRLNSVIVSLEKEEEKEEEDGCIV